MSLLSCPAHTLSERHPLMCAMCLPLCSQSSHKGTEELSPSYSASLKGLVEMRSLRLHLKPVASNSDFQREPRCFVYAFKFEVQWTKWLICTHPVSKGQILDIQS